MSKLSENIKVAITNKRALSDASEYSYDINRVATTIDRLYKVDFKAEFGYSVFVDESQAHTGSPTLKECRDNIKKHVIQDIFGEFKEPLYSLRHSIYDRKWDEALDKLSKLEKQMYE